jgi:hypothetical protein
VVLHWHTEQQKYLQFVSISHTRHVHIQHKKILLVLPVVNSIRPIFVHKTKRPRYSLLIKSSCKRKTVSEKIYHITTYHPLVHILQHCKFCLCTEESLCEKERLLQQT